MAQPYSAFWEKPRLARSEEHTSELQSRFDLVCRLLLEKKKSLLHVLQEHKIDIEHRVWDFWQEFAQAGKEPITLAQLLAPQAGWDALDRTVNELAYASV